MNELMLCAVFIPLIFLAPQKGGGFVQWIPALGGAICVGYFVWLRSGDPILWGGIAVFLAMTLSELSEKKKIKPSIVLSALFFAQSLLAENVGVVILCVVFGDLFLNIEIFSSADIAEKNRAIQNISRSLFSMLPASLAVLLGSQGPVFIFLVALTTILRLFSWPFPHWISEAKKDASFFNLLVSAVSCFALWRSQDFSTFPEWPVIWMVITAVLSLGSQYTEVYIAMTLGAFSVSPLLGLLGAAFWPLLIHRGKSIYLVALFSAVAGVFICEAAAKVVTENSVYVLGGVSALILARPFAFYPTESRPWLNEVRDLLLSLSLFCLFIYLLPVQLSMVGPLGGTFAGAFVLSYIVGKVLRSKRPKIFSPLTGFKGAFLPDLVEPVPSLNETAGTKIDMVERPLIIKFYKTLEGESYLIWLLGVLGLSLYWGLR